MGSVAFLVLDGLSVDIVHGRPEYVHFPVSGVHQFARYADRKGRYAQLPDALRRVHRAMQIAVPPEGLVVAAAGQTGLKATIQKLFGSGQCGPTDTEWHPTSLLVEGGARAWVRRQRWQEGGGDGWFGSPIYHDWAVAGAFIRDAELSQWADALFEHPLGRLIEADTRNYGWVYAPAGTDPRSWPGVEVEDESFSFLGTDDHAVRKGEAQPGVHRTFRVRWGLWSGEVSVHLPEYWQVTTDSEWEHPVCYPFRIARNGREERRFAPPYTSPEADREFLASGRTEEGREVVEYTTELPNLPEYVAPAEASGGYATFWPSLGAWQDFARRHNIRAKRPFIGESVPGGEFVPLAREIAELAWIEGATMLPPISGELPDFRDLPPHTAGYDAQFPAANRVVPDGPFKGLSVYLEGRSGTCLFLGGAWVAAPAGLAVSFGHTVREAGDPTVPGYSETVIYRDGRVHLPRR